MTLRTPSISVVICTWNRAAQLRLTLDSLAGQKGCEGHDVEVIVVDNNSSDDTRDFVEARALDWPLGSLLYAFESQQGKQFALNRGIGLAKAQVLAFTDDDILFQADWLSIIADVFSDLDIDIVGGKTLIAWPPAGRPDWFADSMNAVPGAVDLGAQLQLPAPAHYTPAGGNMAVRRTLFDRVGLFSETHFRHMDHEFGMRCHRAGVRMAYVPRLVVHAPVDDAIMNKRYFRRWAFKAGIASDEAAAEDAKSGGPRLWMYRQLLEDGLSSIALRPLRLASETFEREFRFWRNCGAVSAYWHRQTFRASHAAWVEKHSQKKKNRTF